MTSRSLCFKLMKEDLKRRVWTVALTILSFIFTLLVPVALKSSAYLDRIGDINLEEYEKTRLINSMVEIVGINGAVITVLLVLSVVWAVSGFRYLHNSRQVDFYHSIPVKRHQLFLAAYLNGILAPMALYLIAQGIATVLILRTGIETALIGSLPWKMFLINMVYYSMMYTTTVIAMMMTGNIVIALLGTSVFCGYGPAVTMLTMGYQSEWFHTFYLTETQSAAWLRAVNYSSPFANYILALGDLDANTLGMKRIFGAAAVTAALAVLAYALYRIRPSEAAGKAMAFKKTQSPIKLLIALPVAVVFSIFFYELRSTLAWGIFGAVCGSVLTCCLMEIIYHFDFRRLFANWIQMAGCCIVSVLLLLAGMYDWYGYDSYIPKAANVKSAAVIMGFAEDWVTYGEPVSYKDYRGRESYTWRYGNDSDYQFKHMELTDLYPVMELARKGVEADHEGRSNKADSRSFYGERYTIKFELNNGKAIYRQYNIPSLDEEVMAAREMIHDSKEYKKGTYPLLSQLAADTSSVYFQQYNQMTPLSLNQDEKAHLLAAYQKELEEMTMARRREELPIGTIQFRTAKQDYAITYNEEYDYSASEISERCYYPVYPSFIRTIEAVEKAGASLTSLDSDMISSISIQYYWTGDREINEKVEWEDNIVVYDSKEDIKTLIPALVFNDYANFNEYCEIIPAENAEITVNFTEPRINSYGSRRNLNYRVDLRKLSKEDMARFKLAAPVEADKE